jgi:hypothetical protein
MVFREAVYLPECLEEFLNTGVPLYLQVIRFMTYRGYADNTECYIYNVIFV